MPNSLLPQGLQHTRLPCPSLSLGDISLQGVQVQSLVRELRSHMQCGAAKTFKKQKKKQQQQQKSSPAISVLQDVKLYLD